jgi:hypothetical protein
VDCFHGLTILKPGKVPCPVAQKTNKFIIHVNILIPLKLRRKDKLAGASGFSSGIIFKQKYIPDSERKG